MARHDLHGNQAYGTVAIILHMKLQAAWFARLAVCGGSLAAQLSFAQATAAAIPTQAAMAQVPFVGCASDGQTGPLKAPKERSLRISMPPEAATRLAYYLAAHGPGALAPRGWHCFSTYGSNGTNLFVSPRLIDTKELLSPDRNGFVGPAIQISFVDGDTSGRFEVARVIARVFPAHKQFVQDVIAEGIEPASDFTFGPYTTDKLNYRTPEWVEFETPANTQGLGTVSRLQANANPISGVVFLKGINLIQLSARLPDKDSDLIPIIKHQVIDDALNIADYAQRPWFRRVW